MSRNILTNLFGNLFTNLFTNPQNDIDSLRKVITRMLSLKSFVNRLYLRYLLCTVCLIALTVSSYSYAENVPAYAPIINGEYSGTLYVYGVPVSILMSISSDVYGLGHKFTLTAAQEDLFIIGGNCDCLDSGAVLTDHGLFSECLGIDMGLMDQVALEGWFTDSGYRGELKLFAAGSDISIPSLIGVFELARHQ